MMIRDNQSANQNTESAEKSDIALRSRRHIDVTGVKDVLSFDENSVSMITVCGEMSVEGDGLKIGTLDTDKGIVSVDGMIGAIIYYDEGSTSERKKLFGRRAGR